MTHFFSLSSLAPDLTPDPFFFFTGATICLDDVVGDRGAYCVSMTVIAFFLLCSFWSVMTTLEETKKKDKL